MRTGEVTACAAAVAVLVATALSSGCSRKKRQDAGGGGGSPRAQTTCPVMEGNPVNRSLYVDHDGKRIYVCCGACIDAVKADPEKYVKKLEAEGVMLEKAPTARVWTCPMHPEVRQDAPGECPTCKMDLVPAEKAGGAGARHQE